MRQISSNHLPKPTQKYLDGLQNEIIKGNKKDTATNFAAQVNRAAKTWKPDNKHFTIIKEKLQAMTVAGRCNYCECDRACDIEHIYAKSKFPQFAYTWTNYILSCSYCNSYLKIDKFAVFSPKNSTTKIDLLRNSKPVTDTDAPPTADGLLINPRTENPQDFLRLNIIGQNFFYEPINTDKRCREYQRADYTRSLLDLNNEILATARKYQHSFYCSHLNKYIQAKNANNFDDLQKIIVGDYPFLDRTLDFQTEKNRIVEIFKIEIQKAMYPTVWDELKRQLEHLPRTNELFNAAPEALTW